MYRFQVGSRWPPLSSLWVLFACCLVYLVIFFLDAAIVNFALLGTEYFHISINSLEFSLGGGVLNYLEAV